VRDPEFAEQHPTLKQFDAILVYVPDYKGQPLWINTFADHTPFGYIPHGQGTSAFVVRPDGSALAKVIDYPADANLAVNEIKLALKANGDVEGSIQSKVLGYFDYLCRVDLKDDTPKEMEQFFLTSANAISEGGKSINYKMSNLNDLQAPVTVVQDFVAPELGIVQGDMMIFHIFAPPYYFSSIPAFPPDIVRNYDYALNYQMLVEDEVEITLPRGYKAVFIAPPVTIENKFGSWKSECKLSENRRDLVFSSSIRLIDKTIDTEEYQEFKKAFDDFASPKNSLILLEKEEAQ